MACLPIRAQTPARPPLPLERRLRACQEPNPLLPVTRTRSPACAGGAPCRWSATAPSCCTTIRTRRPTRTRSGRSSSTRRSTSHASPSPSPLTRTRTRTRTLALALTLTLTLAPPPMHRLLRPPHNAPPPPPPAPRAAPLSDVPTEKLLCIPLHLRSRQHSRMLDRERACKKVGPSVAILDPVHDAKGADSQVRTVASCVHHRYSRKGCGRRSR